MNSTAGCLSSGTLKEVVSQNWTVRVRAGRSISAANHRWQVLKILYLLKCTFEKVDFHNALLAVSFIPKFNVRAGC